MEAAVPANESERLEALRRYSILDTLPERDFDDLASLAARICGTPMGLVTLVDANRQWFKANWGLEATETPRDVSFCAHAILQRDLLIIPDATGDMRFSANPLVTGPPHVRFYAGAPLITPDGHALGTLCVMDSVPHELTAEQADALQTLSRQVIAQLELRRTRTDLQSALLKSEERWQALFDKSAIGVALTDEKGRFVAVNHAYEQMLGYTEEELRKLSFLDVTPEGFREPNTALATEIWAGNRQQYELEKPFQRKDGSLIWVRLHASIVSGSGRIPRLGLALCEDITQRKRTEDALRKSEQRNRSLLEINNAIITNLTREALLHSVSEALHGVIPFDSAGFVLYDPEKHNFRVLLAGSGMSGKGKDYQFRSGMEFEPSETICGWVFDHQRAVVRRDLEKEQQYPNDRRALAEGIKSYCVAPLIVRGTSIGALIISSATRNQYSEADSEFLQEVANQVALAVENMRSYEEVHALKLSLEKENVYLQEEIRTEHNFEEIVGNDPALLRALQQVEQVAPTDSTVLILGETGTGKELIARAIHNRSARKDRPLVKVNCSAISAGLVESELFGHVKGAFTGALDRRIGRFELADRGTIFLDEVGELPLETQVKLLRVLQEREFEPVGSNKPICVNVRVIAATNRNLGEAIQTGRFRSDLFYRLNVFPLEVPSLRERRSDIPKLAKFFLAHYSKKLRKNIGGISQNTMDLILNYSWPGNVRELQNVIERAVVLCQDRILELQYELRPTVPAAAIRETEERARPASVPAAQLPTLSEVERSHILAALKLSSEVIDGPKGAAKILNLHPNTLRHRIVKLGIKLSRHDPS